MYYLEEHVTKDKLLKPHEIDAAVMRRLAIGDGEVPHYDRHIYSTYSI